MKAWVFGGMLVLSAALAACSSSSSDDGAGGGSGGGSGEGGGGDGGSASATTGTNTGSTGTNTPTTTSTTTTTSTGGGGEGICGTGLTLDQGGPQDTCLDANCCTEFTACFGADGSNADACNACLEAGGGALCDGLNACFAENECGGGGTGICDSGLTSGDPATDECLGTNCCQEHTDCMADPDACIACFQAGGGALCDAAIACGNENCGGGEGGICDSGLTSGDPALDECLGTNCCQEHNDCMVDEDACIACFQAGGGALCDAAIACGEENCAG